MRDLKIVLHSFMDSIKTDYNNVFITVCEMVRKGLSISNAAKAVGVSRESLYYHMSEKQKKELKVIKMATSKSTYRRDCKNKCQNAVTSLLEDMVIINEDYDQD